MDACWLFPSAECWEAQATVATLGEVEIRREDINMPTLAHQTSGYFVLARMPWQIGGVSELIDQPEVRHIEGRAREETERGRVMRSW